MTVSTYLLPRSVPEALGLLERYGPDTLVMAGGTVAMPLINEGLSLPQVVMGLRKAGLDRIECVDGVLRIGATATLTHLLGQDFVPLLRDSARNTASWSIRNMATVGGNLFTPPPGGDVAVALLALDATVVVASPRDDRAIPLAEFYTGFLTNALGPDELVVEIRVPCVRGGTFIKFGRKHANTPAVVTVATRLSLDGDRVAAARIALGAAGPYPLRAVAAERILVDHPITITTIDAAADAAADESRPFTDAVASDWYRKRMIRLFVARALEQAAGLAREGNR